MPRRKSLNLNFEFEKEISFQKQTIREISGKEIHSFPPIFKFSKEFFSLKLKKLILFHSRLYCYRIGVGFVMKLLNDGPKQMINIWAINCFLEFFNGIWFSKKSPETFFFFGRYFFQKKNVITSKFH